jgi:hypothetical protein
MKIDINKIIKTAQSMQRECNGSGHSGRESYNQPLGYHVFTVFDACVSGEYSLKYSESIEKTSDIKTIREYIGKNFAPYTEDADND